MKVTETQAIRSACALYNLRKACELETSREDIKNYLNKLEGFGTDDMYTLIELCVKAIWRLERFQIQEAG